MTITVSDGQTRKRIIDVPHEDRLIIARDHDPAYIQAIVESNKRLQLDAPHKPTVRLHLQMSPEHFSRICKEYPEVHSGSMDERRRAWERIARNHPELVGKNLENKYGRQAIQRGLQSREYPQHKGILRGSKGK